MKPRKRPLKNLYYRWGRRFGLDAEEVATALWNAGLIGLEPENKYIETDKARAMESHDFETCINLILGRAQDEKFNR